MEDLYDLKLEKLQNALSSVNEEIKGAEEKIAEEREKIESSLSLQLLQLCGPDIHKISLDNNRVTFRNKGAKEDVCLSIRRNDRQNDGKATDLNMSWYCASFCVLDENEYSREEHLKYLHLLGEVTKVISHSKGVRMILDAVDKVYELKSASLNDLLPKRWDLERQIKSTEIEKKQYMLNKLLVEGQHFTVNHFLVVGIVRIYEGTRLKLTKVNKKTCEVERHVVSEGEYVKYQLRSRVNKDTISYWFREEYITPINV